MAAAALRSKVTVVIATRNRARSLDRTLGFFDALSEQPRVVVVDNGSTDDTIDVARRHHCSEAVALGENHGAAARNFGVRRAITPYVAFSDDDSWWAPGALTHAVRALESSPGTALLAARILVGPEGRLDPNCLDMRASPLGTPPDGPGPRVLGFIACGGVVRRDAFLAAGGFDGRLGIGGEERLLAIDLARRGWTCSYVDEVIACHHPKGPREPSRARMTARNEVWIAWMRRPLDGAFRATLKAMCRAMRDGATRSGLLEALVGGLWIASQREPVRDRLAEDVERVYG